MGRIKRARGVAVPMAAASRIALHAALALLVGLAAALPLAASETSNVTLRWTDEELVVAAPSPTVAPGPGARMACAGPATLTLPANARLDVVGIAWGADACASRAAPCVPYALLAPLVGCAPGPGECCVPLVVPASASGSLDAEPVGCLRAFLVDVDADGDGDADASVGPFHVLAACRGA